MSVAVLSPAGTVPATAVNLADLDESTLIERAKSHDSDAFGELYRRYRSDVHRILNHRLREFPADVDDVAAQVFMTALEQITGYQDRGRPFLSWLKTLIHYKALEHRNWRTGRREYELPAPNAVNADLMARRYMNPEDAAILRLELRRLLGSLPARRRLALILRDWAGWSYEDVARALKVSHRAADAVIVEARKAAREMALGHGLAARSVPESGQRSLRRHRPEARDAVRPVTADPALDLALELIAAAGNKGMTRGDLRYRLRRRADRVDDILNLLRERQQIREQTHDQPGRGACSVTRYYAPGAGRAA